MNPDDFTLCSCATSGPESCPAHRPAQPTVAEALAEIRAMIADLKARMAARGDA